MKTRHKQAKDENFPVGSLLIDKKLRPLVAQYYRFARYADDIADNPKLSMKDKLLQLGEMEDILYERIDYKGRKLAFIKTLRRDFIGENLSFSLLTDLLTAFRQDARNYKYETWGQLVEYCRWSAAPVAFHAGSSRRKPFDLSAGNRALRRAADTKSPAGFKI